MRIIAISDTHAKHHEVELPPYQPGDILVHAGDITRRGEIATVQNFSHWLKDLPYEHKLVIAGNHDFCFQDERAHQVMDMLEQIGGAHYLQDECVILNGIEFYGSPWQPWFHNWAFNLQRGSDIARKWELIPDSTNVLITHGPAAGNTGGLIPHVFHRATGENLYEEEVGCEDLFHRIKELSNLKYHICGHIHECYGIHTHPDLTCISVNASALDLRYECVNKPFILPL
jgi:Icc-related predicted phosphoesterase